VTDGQTVRRSDGQTDGQTESIIANTALCIAIAIATHLAAAAAAIVVVVVVLFLLLLVQGATSSTKPKAPIRRFKSDLDEI